MKRPWKKILLILAISLVFFITDSPIKAAKSDVPVIGPVWNWLTEQEVHLGLDLQGGTQLDYEIDLSEARKRNNNADESDNVDITQLLQGVKDVIDQRVNALGVSEPNIYLSEVGDEQHIVVELAGVKDINEAKEKVGKVVLLEFKEQKTTLDTTEKDAIKSEAQKLLNSAHSQADLEELAQSIPENVHAEYIDEGWQFQDQISGDFKDKLIATPNGTVVREVIEAIERYTLGADNQLISETGLNIIRPVDKRKSLRKDPKNAEDFIAVAHELNGKDTNFSYIREDAIPKDIRNSVTTLGTGEISDVLESRSGFYVYSMDTSIPKNSPEEYIRAKHILLNTEEPKTIQPTKPLREIPADASATDKAKLASENLTIEAENKKIQAENAKIASENLEIESRNEAVKQRAQSILDRVNKGEDFSSLAREFSEDTGSKEYGGDLGFFKKGDMVAPFERTAYELKVGEHSELVKSSFGYHIILKTDEKKKNEALYHLAAITFCYAGAEGCESTVSKDDAKKQAENTMRRVREEQEIKWERIYFSTTPDPWQETGLDGRYFKRADVAYDQTTYRPYVAISFNDEGAKLFEQITERNVGKPIAIFVGGEFISAPNVNEKISGGQAQITLGIANIQQALEEATTLARNLNAGSIPAPLKKPNELNISSSLGQDALQKSLRAGVIGLLILAGYMLLVYRLPGLLAIAALIVYALFLLFVIESTMPGWLANIITAVLWLYFLFKIIRSKSDGWSKAVFMILSVFGVFFASNILAHPIVLTLAGVAGVILSIGMAVDANILIFERMKEEFKLGRDFISAVEVGFERAWSSILDSNVSSLITCGILFFFGTSIIRGFAINLAVGILISMFTAITVTKTFLLIFAGTKASKNKKLWMGKN
jgi:preprotein translocase subunit SecD